VYMIQEYDQARLTDNQRPFLVEETKRRLVIPPVASSRYGPGV